MSAAQQFAEIIKQLILAISEKNLSKILLDNFISNHFEGKEKFDQNKFDKYKFIRYITRRIRKDKMIDLNQFTCPNRYMCVYLKAIIGIAEKHRVFMVEKEKTSENIQEYVSDTFLGAFDDYMNNRNPVQFPGIVQSNFPKEIFLSSIWNSIPSDIQEVLAKASVNLQPPSYYNQ